jgi:Fe2+ transport system protein FeoA
VTLKDVKKAEQKFVIRSHQGPKDLCERLNELGFRKDSECEFVGRTPLKGPLLFKLGPMVMALRENEAECLLVEPL